MEPEAGGNLSFSFHATKGEAVAISRGGRVVTVLGGHSARRFLAKVAGASFAAQQQLMARATGNYKRGNERVADPHPDQGSRDA